MCSPKEENLYKLSIHKHHMIELPVAFDIFLEYYVRLDMFPSCTGDADEIGQGAISAKTKRGKKYNPDLDPTQSNAHNSNMDATDSNVH